MRPLRLFSLMIGNTAKDILAKYTDIYLLLAGYMGKEISS